MVDEISILRPTVPVYDPMSGRAVGGTQTTALWTGRAHIHPTTPSGTITVGEGMTAMAVISVTVPYDIDPVPMSEDHVVVTSVGLGNDATLVGETFRILNVSGGGIGFVTRTLTCTVAQPNPFDPLA